MTGDDRSAVTGKERRQGCQNDAVAWRVAGPGDLSAHRELEV